MIHRDAASGVSRRARLHSTSLRATFLQRHTRTLRVDKFRTFMGPARIACRSFLRSVASITRTIASDSNNIVVSVGTEHRTLHTAHIQEFAMRTTGTVKWFNDQKG